MELLVLLAISYLFGVEKTHGKYEQAGIKKPPAKPKDKWNPTWAPETFRNAPYNFAAKTHYGLLAGAHIAGGLRDGWRSAYLKKPSGKPSVSTSAGPTPGPSATTVPPLSLIHISEPTRH
nr:hypothetical protein [Streptomyces chryseus]